METTQIPLVDKMIDVVIELKHAAINVIPLIDHIETTEAYKLMDDDFKEIFRRKKTRLLEAISKANELTQ